MSRPARERFSAPTPSTRTSWRSPTTSPGSGRPHHHHRHPQRDLRLQEPLHPERLRRLQVRRLDDFSQGIGPPIRYTIVPRAGGARASTSPAGPLRRRPVEREADLTSIYGLRVDVPYFPDDPTRNPVTRAVFGLAPTRSPTASVLWSPRVGFNWDIGGTGSEQFRGGWASSRPYSLCVGLQLLRPHRHRAWLFVTLRGGGAVQPRTRTGRPCPLACRWRSAS